MLKRFFFTILFTSWVVLITFLSLFSFSGLDTDPISIPYADKITHFIFYLVFVILGCLAMNERKKGNMSLKTTVFSFALLAVVYGMFIEVLQHILTEDRMAEYGDALANTIGAIFGALLIWWYISKKGRLKRKI